MTAGPATEVFLRLMLFICLQYYKLIWMMQEPNVALVSKQPNTLEMLFSNNQ